jgi:hypothetical protein
VIALDYVGLGAVISATFAGIVSVLVAMRQTGVKAQVQQIHDQVQVAGPGSIGETLDHVHDVVCGEAEKDKVPP